VWLAYSLAHVSRREWTGWGWRNKARSIFKRAVGDL